MNEIANKRILNYYFAQELKAFLSKYKGGKMSSNRKKLVLYILYLFGRFKNNVPINTDNYRALMRDYNKSPIKLSLFTVNGQSFPLILLPNPEIEKIRSKYRRFIEEMWNFEIIWFFTKSNLWFLTFAALAILPTVLNYFSTMNKNIISVKDLYIGGKMIAFIKGNRSVNSKNISRKKKSFEKFGMNLVPLM